MSESNEKTNEVENAVEELRDTFQQAIQTTARTSLHIDYGRVCIARDSFSRRLGTYIIGLTTRDLSDDDQDTPIEDLIPDRYKIDGWLKAHRDDDSAKDIIESADKEPSVKEELGIIDELTAGIKGIINPETKHLLIATCEEKIFLPDGEKYRTFYGGEIEDFAIDGKQAFVTTTSKEKFTIDLHEWVDDGIRALELIFTTAKMYTKSIADFHASIGEDVLKNCGFKSLEEAEEWLRKEEESSKLQF